MDIESKPKVHLLKPILKKGAIIACVVLAVSVVISKDWIYWNGILQYNKLAPQEYQISMEDRESNSLKSEIIRLKALLYDGDFSLYNTVLIEDGAMISSTRLSGLDVDKIYSKFEKYDVQADVFSKEPKYALLVAQAQWFGGQSERTQEILDRLIASEHRPAYSQEFLDEVHVTRACVALSLCDMKGTLDSLDSLQTQEYLEMAESMRKYMNQVLNVDVDYKEELVDAFRQNKNQYTYWIREISNRNDWLKNRQSESKLWSDSGVQGSVTLDGKPVEGALIYTKHSRGMNQFIPFEGVNAATDSNGEYHIDNIPEDTIGLGIMLPWQLIHEKQWTNMHSKRGGLPVFEKNIDFEFVDGARFETLLIKDDKITYEIYDPNASKNRFYYLKVYQADHGYSSNVGSYDISIEPGKLSGQLSLDQLRKASWSAAFYNTSGNPLHYKRYMEPLYLSGDYYFSISPYERDSQYYVSNGLFTDALGKRVYVEGKASLNEGDAYIASGDFDKAIAWYDENPSLHNLKVLFTLYRNGYTIESTDPYIELGGVDTAKALTYLREIIDKYGENSDNLSELARVYRTLGMYAEEEDVRRKIIESNKASIYDYIALFDNVLNQGRYREAVKIIDDLDNISEEKDRFLSAMLIGSNTSYLPNEYVMTLDQIDSEYDMSAYYELIYEGRYQDAWTALDRVDDEDVRAFYQLLMLDALDKEILSPEAPLYDENDFDDFLDYYVKTTMELENQDLAKILKFLKVNHNWFHDDF